VKRLLDRPNYAHVATLLPDGAPHTVPVWIAREGEDVVILTGPVRGKRVIPSVTLGLPSRSSMLINRTRRC
jgi:Pyridoxamine 5'-phosphate oxidase